MAIIGIVLGATAIGLFIWLKKEQQKYNDFTDFDIDQARKAYQALMEDYNKYQVRTDRKIAELEKQVEWLPKNTDRKIENLKKDLPKEIRGVIGHIEFAQNNLR